jgi:hypothetical protein
MKIIFLCCIFCFFSDLKVFAQKKSGQVQVIKEKSMVTGKDNEWKIVGRDAVIVRDSSTHYIQYHITETGSILYGNRCAEEASSKMGVEFILIPKDIGSGMRQRNMYFTNLRASIKATLKNGFFWKKRLEKRIKKCRDGTSDFNR